MAEAQFAVRDHFLSVYQSAVTEVAAQSTGTAEQKASLVEAAGKLAAMRSDGSSDLAPMGDFNASVKKVGEAQSCATLGLMYFEAKVRGDAATVSRIADELKLSSCDSGWVKTLTEYVGYFGPWGTPAAIPYVRAATVGSRVITIPADPVIGVIGDWGTGGNRARAILEQIKSMKPDILVHLGDVYYSGTATEYQENFISVVDDVFDRENTNLPVFTLAGNHDMYSGGKGYYGAVGSLNPGDAKQGASFFCLRSADNAWQLLAMDTGYHDYNPFNVSDAVTFLEEDEQNWHLDRLKEFKGKTILMSHHQLFSAFSPIGATTATGKQVPYNPKLLTTFQAFAKANDRIVAWLWGHEHNLSIYEDNYLGLARGRCLGHGAIPVLLKDAPYKLLQKIKNLPKIIDKTRLDVDGDTYTNGFALLSLKATGHSTAAYYQNLKGKPDLLLQEELTVAAPA